MTSHYAALWDTLYLRKQQEEHSAWYHGGHIQEAASAAVGVQAYIYSYHGDISSSINPISFRIPLKDLQVGILKKKNPLKWDGESIWQL